MNISRAAQTLLCTAILAAAVFPASAKADEWDRKTTVTFSGPVEIPGVHVAGWGVLPAGTYVFKILDSQQDRHIVQIFNKDETVCYATILAIPNFRLKATDKTVITFRERPAGQPEALRAWFYPGRQWGEEFVYPKAKAMEIATTTKTPVLFTPVEIPVEVAVPITPDAPFVAQLKTVPVKAYQPAGTEVEIAEVVTPPPPAEMQVAAALPKTASDLPLAALLGTLALACALIVRSIRIRML
jgi:hypothetical protein